LEGGIVGGRGLAMTDDDVVGQTLAGKYRIEKILGKGGMGLVLGARHLKLDEPVAIKLLRAAMMEVDGMVARFLREARAASKIKSVHVARVTDVDTLDTGVPYMVMEYLTGTDLADLRRKKGQLGVVEAVGYVLEATEAIAEAHALGIVHRDLKPANLFLHEARDGTRVLKVLDFGISKLEAPGEEDSTKTGQMMGSPKYMSPEQMLSMRDVDGRSDIWSLGAVLYELLAGRPPFVADSTPRVCALVLHNDPAPPSTLRPDLPPALERAVLRCLEKDPQRRFPTVTDLAEALAPFGPPPEPVLKMTGAFRKPPSAGPISAPPAPPSVVEAVTSAGAADQTDPDEVSAALNLPSPARPSPPAPLPLRGRGEPRRFRAAAVIVGLSLAGALGVVYFAQRGQGTTAASPLPPPSAPPAAEAPPPPTVAPTTAEPARTAYNLSDLPDVRPPVASHPPSHGGAPLPSALKPKPSADPFGGRRN
jgi:serine/threonine-protein kinase